MQLFKILNIFFVLAIITFVHAEEESKEEEKPFYSEDDGVVLFKSAEEFKKTVLESGEVWLVELYVPWCGMCKQLSPEWKRTAKFLKNAIKVAAVNIDDPNCREIGNKYNVKTIPSIRLFGFDKKKEPTLLEDKRDAVSITEAAVTFLAEEVDVRVNGKRGTKTKDGKKFGAKTVDAEDTDAGDVVVLDDENFDKTVMNSDDIWLIEFYAPWCGHCKTLAPKWKKVATKLLGKVKLAKLDAEKNRVTAARFSVSSYPTIKVFEKGQKSVEKAYTYNGERRMKDLYKYGEELYNDTLKQETESPDQEEIDVDKTKKESTEDRVVVLTSENFDKLVMESKDIWMVEFYAPWCGHCKKLEPQWKAAAAQLYGKIKLGKIDCDIETAVKDRFSIEGYPSIRMFPYGKKTDKNSEDYDGARETGDIVLYAEELIAKSDIDPEVVEINSQAIYDANCHSRICIIYFVPNIYDSNAVERNNLLDEALQSALKFKKSPIAHLWLQAGDQLDLERQLNLGFGFPAVVAVSPVKKLYSIMHGSFSLKNLNNYVQELLDGRGKLQPLNNVKMTFKNSPKWDRTDAPVIVEEPEPIEETTDDGTVVQEEL